MICGIFSACGLIAAMIILSKNRPKILTKVSHNDKFLPFFDLLVRIYNLLAHSYLQFHTIMLKSNYKGGMLLKLTTVITDGDEEIVIKCNDRSDKIVMLEDLIKNALGTNETILLTSGQMQYYIAVKDILFCESLEGKVACHTADGMFYSDMKLYELEAVLPSSFGRASKSSIINGKQIYSIRKNIAGSSEVTFRQSTKKAYLSRSYFKSFTEKINETRLKK